jgi:alkanesulfonate monooxygenase SsuD/methylene tetrahydromethanopterin reductase-like flavin-dependent oxidoreductase (luciferase family)
MPSPKVIVQLYPVFPAEDEHDRRAKAPLGRDSGLYNKIIHEWTDIVKAADEMGVWGMSTIEHHLHSEGYEVGPNPGVLNAHWAAHTKNIHVGAFGYVMATHDPIRVAEETAIIDHLTNGKYFVGFARGYQSRWTNILGQGSDAVATVSDGSANDAKNREIFEERVEMVLDCWTKDSVELNGKYYQAPYPHDTGIANYEGYEIAREAGAEGEIDGDGVLRRISVVPKPFQDPHPPVFCAVARSRATIEFAAKHGFRPSYFNPTDGVVELANVYVEESAKHGRQVQFGQMQNIVRHTRIGKSAADFDRKLRAYDLDIFKNFYSVFGNHNVDPVNHDAEAAFRAMKEHKFILGGTVDDAIADWQEIYSRIPCEYITLIWHWAQQPKDELLEEIQLFMEKVVPELETPDFDAIAAE